MLAEAMSSATQSCLHASIILAVVLAATSTMRRASASTRHWIWTCAVVAVALAPLMSTLLPGWEVGPVPGLGRMPSVASPASRVASAGVIEVPLEQGERTRAAVSGMASSPLQSLSPSFHVDPVRLVAIVWASGTTMVLLYAFTGMLAAWRIRRSTVPPPAECLCELRALAESHDVRWPIGIGVSGLTMTPIVSGIWRPLIVFPRGVFEWSSARLRVVLLHELAHIKRRDCLTQMLARLICAAYWFNPLVWIAASRLRIEQERACDDFVLAAGTKASEYAGHLTGIARSTQPVRMSALAAATLAMARRSQMESRLMAILDPAIQRSSAFCARVASAGMMLLVVILLSALQLHPAGATAAVAVAEDAGASKSHDAARLIAAAHEGQVDVVRHLLDEGIDVGVTSGGWNALVAAAHEGQVKAVELLLVHGADANAAPNGQSALVAAAHEGQVKTVELLLNRGADVNAAAGGRSALVAAAHEGQLKTVELLLDRGADVNAAPGGQSALAAAAHEGQLDVVKLLVERGALTSKDARKKEAR